MPEDTRPRSRLDPEFAPRIVMPGTPVPPNKPGPTTTEGPTRAPVAPPAAAPPPAASAGVAPTPAVEEEDSTSTVEALPGRSGARGDMEATSSDQWWPRDPKNLEEAGLVAGDVEALVVKYLLGAPGSSGHDLTHALGLPTACLRGPLNTLKQRRQLYLSKASAIGDYAFELSEEGRNLAHDLKRISRYAGAAPVTMDAYVESVREQSVARELPTQPRIREAFSDLIVEDGLLDCLGPAITAGRGVFFHGPPGNGKTSLAERITRAYGSPIYIPYALRFGGQIIRIFDRAVHEPLSPELAHKYARGRRVDRRWVLCKRPTIVVGGELTLAELELALDEASGTCEAPIQMKANGGTLVIDDLGRQAMPADKLLNRWIVPMEKRVDYLAVPGGRKMEAPFNLMLVFSTNLEPRTIVDDAFLRRIPYKVHVGDPAPALFQLLFERQAVALGVRVERGAMTYLLQTHFSQRPLRKCHPRDLLTLVMNICRYRAEEPVAKPSTLDQAVQIYFGVK